MAANVHRADPYLARWSPARLCEALRPHVSGRRAERIEAVLACRLAAVTASVENLYDHRNGLAAIRSAEAMGLADFHAIEEKTPFPMRGKASLSSHRWLDVHRHPTTRGFIEDAHDRGVAVWAASPEATTPLGEVPVDGPLTLLFGNERDGLTEEAIAGSDGTFRIVTRGFTTSFNLSVAVALALHAVVERYRARLEGPGDLPAERVALLRARWYFQSVRAAEQILRRAGWTD